MTAPTGAQIVADARRYLGVPYLYGGTNPKVGMDCSGLVYVVCHDLGITSVPRTSEEQWAWTKHTDTPGAGNLVFFVGSDGEPGSPGHVGIVVSPGLMIDEPYTGLSCQQSGYSTNGTGANELIGYGVIPNTTASPTGTASTLSVQSQQQQSGSIIGALAGVGIALVILIFAVILIGLIFIVGIHLKA
jgi:peptidoglycan DL-endopeptidase CwlO